jgi:hypothetical protein
VDQALRDRPPAPIPQNAAVQSIPRSGSFPGS